MKLDIRSAVVLAKVTNENWQSLEQKIRIRISDDGKFIMAATQYKIHDPARKNWNSVDYIASFS